jgi:hypothetical protein
MDARERPHQPHARHSGESRNPAFYLILNRLRRCGKANSGFRAASGLLFFACAKKSNQKKTHPIARRAERRAVPCAPRLSRALRNSHESKIAIRAQTVLAHNPGLSSGARRAQTGPRIKNKKCTHSTHSQNVGFDVGTRSRRRASQPRPGEVASRCLSRARCLRSASSARARSRREAQGVSAAPGRAFFGLPFFARAKKGNTLPRGQRHHSFSSIAAGDSTRSWSQTRRRHQNQQRARGARCENAYS